MKQSRKTFLKVLGVSSLTAAINPIKASAGYLDQPQAENELILGLASYTLRKFDLEETLEMAARLNLEYVAFKSMHMPMDSSDEEIKAIVEKVKASGRKLYGAGVIYMKSEEEVDNAFRYAKAAGLKVIIGVPNPDLLDRVEKRVKETDIRLAIHNHGPEDDTYPSPKSAFDRIANMDQRMGLCVDIGHTLRSGYDPAKVIKQYKDRVYDVHLKDINSSEPDGKTLEMGRGVMDIPSVIKALRSINYKGVMAVEYEKDGDDPLPGLAESVGFARGVMKTV
jgi:inosose dehydratase